MPNIEPGRFEPPGQPDRLSSCPVMWVVLERSAHERGLEEARPVAVFTEAVEALRFVSAGERSMFVVPVPHVDATGTA